MAAPTPEFTDSFVVEKDNYGDFIRLVRQNVIKYCSDRRPNVVQPVLPPEQKIPKFWFHIVLRTMTSSLTLAVRIDNLYLVGFRTPAGVWWEFNNEHGTHLISNSNWLGFGGRYQDLVGQKGLETVSLGRAQMTVAVDVLAKHGTTQMSEEQVQDAKADPYALPKSMLVKLVIMICEGVRFHTVYSTVDKEFNNVAAKITEIEGKQVNKWDRISKAVLTWAVDPMAKFPELEKIGVKDKNDAARIVALVKDEK
ncbi:ribosome-inactivating protein-like [Phragmites australis]|uniref:ribosome-inactivating protein-like n=1 Tax=Phragmites australis TaxID=29695 RepID=UPI002D77E8B2|nr:ribosome-inactivating protein-like [Phragmites australis]